MYVIEIYIFLINYFLLKILNFIFNVCSMCILILKKCFIWVFENINIILYDEKFWFVFFIIL